MIGLQTASLAPTFHLMAGRIGEGSDEREDRQFSSLGRAIRKVAIVEDELMVAWTIESMIEDLGLDVVGVFSNGEDAIAALESVTVDLVCMGINLGRGIDGIEAAQQIRQTQPAAILFISAYSDKFTQTRVEEIAPDAILVSKPTSMAALKQAISNFTRSHK